MRISDGSLFLLLLITGFVSIMMFLLFSPDEKETICHMLVEKGILERKFETNYNNNVSYIFKNTGEDFFVELKKFETNIKDQR